MSAEGLALLAAAGWAGEAVLIRKGSVHGKAVTALFFVLTFTTVVLWCAAAAFSPLSALRSKAVLFFLVGGLIQPVAVRYLHYVGIERLGVSRADPIRGLTPLFAVALAYVALGERVPPAVYAGVAAIVTGAWLVCRTRAGETAWKTSDLAFPLGAALLGAVSQLLRKSGLDGVPYPLLGAAVTNTASWLTLVAVLSASGTMEQVKPSRNALPFYAGAAVVSTAAQIINYTALEKGQVSTVVPLVNTHPLFALLFAVVFASELERVNAFALAGAGLVVGGTFLIWAR